MAVEGLEHGKHRAWREDSVNLFWLERWQTMKVYAISTCGYPNEVNKSLLREGPQSTQQNTDVTLNFCVNSSAVVHTQTDSHFKTTK